MVGTSQEGNPVVAGAFREELGHEEAAARPHGGDPQPHGGRRAHVAAEGLICKRNGNIQGPNCKREGLLRS